MSKAKILIVEDDGIVAMDIEKRLKNFGYDVCGKISYAEKAIEAVKEVNPNLVLMDIVLKGEMDGIEATKTIQSRYGVPVVFLTAHADEEKFERAKVTTPFGYIIKPFRNKEFKNTIEMALYKDKVDAKLRQVEKQKQELRLRLLNSQKMEAIGQLAAGVAHEINNPVGFIGSNLDALTDYMKDIAILLKYYQKLGNLLKNFNKNQLSGEIKRQIQTISEHEQDIEIDYLKKDIPELLNDCKDGADRIGKIVGDLKSFAHPGKDKQMPININSGLESTLNVVNNELKYKASIIKDLGEIPMVEGYPQKLNQVFMNILVNAAQAIKEKGEIKIQTKKDKHNVIISISDTGCGIEKKNLTKIFDPFFTTKEVGKGTGLGMNISYNIIREHKGTIEVESQIGRGTTFTITLPGKRID